MSETDQRHEMARRGMVYQAPGADAVIVRRDLEYQATDAGALTMDLYRPPDLPATARLPAVVFVIGYSDLGAQAFFGCKFKEMESFIGWARSTAAAGLAAITYTTGKQPAADAGALLRHLREHAASLGIDENRLGLWACSGHGPNAMSVLMREAHGAFKCAALCYPFLLDLEGSTTVAEASRTFRFANPGAGKSVDDLPSETAVLLVRAGQDEIPGLNATLDRCLAAAVQRNLPITLVNHPAAPHAFDILHDSDTSRRIIRQVLSFLQLHLG
jgi:acetyl esterase/lipase